MSITYEQKAPAALEQLKLITALAQLDSASQQVAAHSWSYFAFPRLPDVEIGTHRLQSVSCQVAKAFSKFLLISSLLLLLDAVNVRAISSMKPSEVSCRLAISATISANR